jgi:hypothetical protein
MTTTDAPPRWDLSPIFGGVDDRSFNIALEGVYARIDRLVALYDELDVRDTAPRAVEDADVSALESVLHATNELQAELRPISTYLYALISTEQPQRSRRVRDTWSCRRGPRRSAPLAKRPRARGSRRSAPTS